ncbi:class I SAM-dependent methyltransferase [Streptomyces sp. NPDC004008]
MTRPTDTPAGEQLAALYDAFHAARARTDLVARLYADAMGEDYPHEIVASGSCDWPLLGLLAARLRMRPGRLLVDAGCGTGGIGLWLARALAVRLHGLDLSREAVDQASARSHHFVPPGRAAFRVATLTATGLPDGCAHGAVCIDALSAATDRTAALCELGRILAPGARAELTRSLRRDAKPRWETQAHAAGLVVEHVDERPDEPAMWGRLYRLWIDHAAELRAVLGDAQADNMLAEAHRMLPKLPGRRAVLLTLRRPPAQPEASEPPAKMARPGHRPGDAPAPDERTPL